MGKSWFINSRPLGWSWSLTYNKYTLLPIRALWIFFLQNHNHITRSLGTSLNLSSYPNWYTKSRLSYSHHQLSICFPLSHLVDIIIYDIFYCRFPMTSFMLRWYFSNLGTQVRDPNMSWILLDLSPREYFILSNYFVYPMHHHISCHR